MNTSSSQPDPLKNPTPTKEKRAAAFVARIGKGVTREQEREIPALDCRALSQKYGMDQAHKPRMHEGTFTAPLGLSTRNYEQLRQAMIRRFLESMDKQGWDFVSDHRIQVYPGVYPARDLLTGLDLLDRREMRVRAYFRFRNPQPVTLELPPELVAAVPITA